jgi:hypothetical protein
MKEIIETVSISVLNDAVECTFLNNGLETQQTVKRRRRKQERETRETRFMHSKR